MVSATSETFDQLLAKFEPKFTQMVPAEALFWKKSTYSGYEYGLRIEAPTIMKEFVNKVTLGRDPRGNLFFDRISDLNQPGLYDVYYSTTTVKDQSAVVVEFFYIEESTQDRITTAVFLAKDPSNSINYCLADQSGGSWTDLKSVSASAHLTKVTKGSTVTLDLPGVKKKATFTHKDDKVGLDVWGVVSFKKLEALVGDNAYVDYNSDRLVFYEHSGLAEAGSADFTAFFIPMDTARVDDMGGMNFETSGVSWKST